MDREYLTKYIDIIGRLEAGETITDSEYQLKYNIENDYNLNDLIKALNSTDSYNIRSKIIDDYIKKEEFEKESETKKIEDAIKKEFGLDLVYIEHMKLQSGISIIAFYDNKISRKRLIEYNSAKSLVEDFTNIQNENANYQTEDYRNNSDAIAKDEANKNHKRELEMIDINRAKNEYFELINRIKDNDPTKIQAINELIKESDKRHIKYINFENMIALDNNGNIIESFYNIKDDKFELETPEKLNSSVDKIDNEESTEYEQYTETNINQNINEENKDELEKEDDKLEPSEFEKKEEIDAAEAFDNLEEGIGIYHINCSKEQAIDNIKKYSEDMNLLEDDLNKNKITQEEYEFYKSYCERYINLKEQRLNKAKTLEYKDNGFISMLIISIITIIIGIIILVLTI